MTQTFQQMSWPDLTALRALIMFLGEAPSSRGSSSSSLPRHLHHSYQLAHLPSSSGCTTSGPETCFVVSEYLGCVGWPCGWEDLGRSARCKGTGDQKWPPNMIQRRYKQVSPLRWSGRKVWNCNVGNQVSNNLLTQTMAFLGCPSRDGT